MFMSSPTFLLFLDLEIIDFRHPFYMVQGFVIPSFAYAPFMLIPSIAYREKY